MWVWGVEVMVVNAYKMMTQYFEMKGIKATYGHHKFQENIAHKLIDPVHNWPRRGDRNPDNNIKRKSASTKRK